MATVKIVPFPGVPGPQGPRGLQGIQGDTGLTGPMGPAGTVTIVDAPATATSAGNTGEIAYDSTYLYVCVDTNSWVRAQLDSWI